MTDRQLLAALKLITTKSFVGRKYGAGVREQIRYLESLDKRCHSDSTREDTQ
jgi:hypothetical protein